jgi:hypothetical protein
LVECFSYFNVCARFALTAQPFMASNRRPAGLLDGSDDLAAIVAADRAFPSAVAELGSLGGKRHE